MNISNFNLGIGIPLSWTHVPTVFFESFIKMKKPEYVFLRDGGGGIEELRNNLVRKALVNRCTHLLMIDADMTFHPDTIPRLLSHKLPIVGALCYRRYPPFDPLMYKGEINTYELIEDFKMGDLVEVDATGTGCILYETNMFQKMPEPWFRFRPNPNQELGGVVGEDIGFCSDLRKAGYKIYVDTSVPTGHLTMFEVNESAYKLYKAMKLKSGGN